MPQLDTLTYLTQYVFLLITFVGTYFFVLSFIIPKTLCAFKVRQKLNSLNAEVDLIDASKKSMNTFVQYNELINSNWRIETAKIGSSRLSSRWLVSARALQLALVIRLKKLLCTHTVQNLREEGY
jgi:Plant ATP synthase F0